MNFKRGDFVADGYGWVMIIDRLVNPNQAYGICVINPDNLLLGVGHNIQAYFERKATPDEIKRIHRVLCKNGYQYDSKNFKIIKSEF